VVSQFCFAQLFLTSQCADRIFYQALAQFEHIRIYANGINDRTVPYVTAAIEVSDPFADYESSGLEVFVYSLPLPIEAMRLTYHYTSPETNAMDSLI
jgi:hypothetical protein